MRPYQMLVISRCMVSVALAVLGFLAVFLLLEVSWTQHRYRRYSPGGAVWISELLSGDSHVPSQNLTCVDRLAAQFNRVEDLFCIVLPKFIPHLKNMCFYDYALNNQKQLRCLPYFYILGMDKSGTTDLHNRLTQHPFVLANKAAWGKETYFWSMHRYGIYNKRLLKKKYILEDYLQVFENTAKMVAEPNMTNVITGDATPMDLWDFRYWPIIPQNFEKNEPEVLTPHLIQHIYRERTPKFLIQLREPVERLYSDYIFLRYGSNPQQFHNHSLQSIDMMTECLRNNSKRLCYFSETIYRQLPTRIHLGCYSVFLQEWFRVFPRSQFLITTVDEYEKDMKLTLLKVFAFLDLPPLPDNEMAQIVNKARRHVTRNKTGVVLPETVKALRHFYDGCNKDTARLLNDERFLWSSHYL